jgi:NAD(P)H-nitrite reductase large subunit
VWVLAVGVRPNVELIRDAGGEVGRAVKVDDAMRTSLPDVYAAGDLTLSHDVSDNGAEKVLALWPNAYMQGYVGGRSMAGAEAQYDRACPMNAGGFFGLHMVGAGNAIGEAILSRTPGGIKKLYVNGDFLSGYVLIGDVERAGIYTALIRDRTPLSSIDFELVAQRPQLMAFSSRARARMLGGNKA